MAKKLLSIYSEDDAAIIDDDDAATLRIENTSTGVALTVERSATAGPTIAPLRAVMSIASGAFLEVQGAFVSTASMNLAASNTAFHIPVYHGSKNVLGYIAVSKGPS